jgi:hypothetical protein
MQKLSVNFPKANTQREAPLQVTGMKSCNASLLIGWECWRGWGGSGDTCESIYRELASVLIRIQNILGSNLDPNTGYPE